MGMQTNPHEAATRSEDLAEQQERFDEEAPREAGEEIGRDEAVVAASSYAEFQDRDRDLPPEVEHGMRYSEESVPSRPGYAMEVESPNTVYTRDFQSVEMTDETHDAAVEADLPERAASRSVEGGAEGPDEDVM
jgi:hypothetical protein